MLKGGNGLESFSIQLPKCSEGGGMWQVGPGGGTAGDRAGELETFTPEFALLPEQLRSSTETGRVFTFRDFSHYSLIK